METILILATVQGLLGAFDTLYHHEFLERLSWRESARREITLHGVRNAFYVVIFLSFGWFEWRGVLCWAFVGLLLLEVMLTLRDFVIEDETRLLPPSERITHTLLALNYGAVLAVLAPSLIHWSAQPTAMAIVDRGPWAWVMTLFAAGLAMFAARDLSRARHLASRDSEPADNPAESLPRGLHVLITGGTGFIGGRLRDRLSAAGHHVTVLTRDRRKGVRGDGPVTLIDSLDQLSDDTRIDAIVNLAGEPLANGRWTKAKKIRFRKSRTGTTRAVVDFIRRSRRKPRVLISGSAIGFYGDSGEREMDETATPPTSFSRRLCADWESVALTAAPLGVRVCLLRTGIVLAGHGGALGQMLLPFEFGLGGRMGDGRHWMSWIHLDDIVALICHAIATDSIDGPINATAPYPVRNADFTEQLGRALHRPARLPVPTWLLRLLLGEMAREILLASQRVVPAKALRSGFRFRYPKLAPALRHIVDGAAIPDFPPERNAATVSGVRVEPTKPM